jgi:hypothetical protein
MSIIAGNIQAINDTREMLETQIISFFDGNLNGVQSRGISCNRQKEITIQTENQFYTRFRFQGQGG